ncbi:hypothetical protein KUTeg_013784 [Tegillarca granosa]|uniref:Uncharacterized protein n=1 Tax=Tegillarca granosa TaxID=220873 RepID=A0ABQ9EZU3_TEGGR|nr:hypothetical protein KUTeg_013784 [Tegillarca granosa]
MLEDQEKLLQDLFFTYLDDLIAKCQVFKCCENDYQSVFEITVQSSELFIDYILWRRIHAKIYYFGVKNWFIFEYDINVWYYQTTVQNRIDKEWPNFCIMAKMFALEECLFYTYMCTCISCISHDSTRQFCSSNILGTLVYEVMHCNDKAYGDQRLILIMSYIKQFAIDMIRLTAKVSRHPYQKYLEINHECTFFVKN